MNSRPYLTQRQKSTDHTALFRGLEFPYKHALIWEIRLIIQIGISPEQIDTQRSFYACSNANYMPNNNFNNPAPYK
jgi:hypothetical protein